MLRKRGQSDPSSCPPWQLLLRHVVQAERLPRGQREFIVEHITQCQRCCGMYGVLCDAEADLWGEAAKAAGVPRREPVFTCSPGEALAGLWRRIDGYEAKHRQRRRAIVFRIGRIAAAACILIAISIGWLTLRNGSSRQLNSDLAANSGGSFVTFGALMSDQGHKPLALNQTVITRAQPQEILLGGKHRMVMSHHTQAILAAAPTTGGQGRATGAPQSRHDTEVAYEIQLVHGELYVEVVPGSAFTVTTDNARLDITGTKFDVRADGNKTEVILLKGSVRFGVLDQRQQAVNVAAGYASTIVGRRAPSTPAPVDAVATTAWARDTAFRNAIARADAQMDIDLSGLGQGFWRQPALPDVDTLDYATWRDRHGRFQLAFRLLAATREGPPVKADWIELLMIGGDIWQFHYDPMLPSSQSLTKTEPTALARLARHFGLDEREMWRSLGLPDSTPIARSPAHDRTPGQQYADALRRWHDALTTGRQQLESDSDRMALFSLRASQYLADTRTAAYLWAKTHPQQARQLLADNTYIAMLPMTPGTLNEDEWLEQLRQQAVAARSCIPAAMEGLLVPVGTGCAPQTLEQQRKLAALVSEMVPAWPDRREGQGQ